MIRLALLSLLLAALPAQVHEWRGIRFHGIVEPVAVGSTIALVVWSTDTDTALQFLPGAPRLTLHGVAWFAQRLTSDVLFCGATDAGCASTTDTTYNSGRGPLLSDYRLFADRTVGPLTAPCTVHVTNYLWSAPHALLSRGLIVSPVNGWNQ